MVLNTKNIVYLVFLQIFATIIQIQHISTGSVPTSQKFSSIDYFGSHYFQFYSSVQAASSIPSLFMSPPNLLCTWNFVANLGKTYSNVSIVDVFLSSFQSTVNYYVGFDVAHSYTGSSISSVNIAFTVTQNSSFSLIGLSVLIISPPLSQIASMLYYTLNLPGTWYTHPIALPVSYDYFMYIKSFHGKADSSKLYLDPYYSITFLATTINIRFTSQTEAGYSNQIKLFIMVMDKTKKATLAQLSLLFWNQVIKIDNIFPTNTFNINTGLYGTDFNKICMFGFHKIDVLNKLIPYFKYDLNPAIGIVNGAQNSIFRWSKIQSVCFRLMKCPSTNPYQKPNDVNCYDCSPGYNFSTNQNISNCTSGTFMYQYNNSGNIISVCSTCTQCEDHYYAQNGSCNMCNATFPNCQLCNETWNCYQCFAGYNLSGTLCQLNCLPTQFYSNGSCNLCNVTFPNCQLCIINCYQCFSGYNLVGTLCQLNCLPTQFYLNGTCHLCDTIFPNCETCNQTIHCESCKIGFNFNSSTFLCDIICLANQCSQNGTCYLCQNYIPACLECNSRIYCTKCNQTSGLFLDTGLCVPCSIKIPNCIECYSSTVCKLCQDNYYFQNYQCQTCTTLGYISYKGYCMKFPGCLNTAVKNGELICVSCVTQLRFTYNPITKECVCQHGLIPQFFQGTHTQCITQCGDGNNIYPEQCDDNNTNQNDGCSKSCKVEDGYVCSDKSPSKCVIKRDFVRFQYNYIERIKGQNKALLTFTLTPHFIGLQNLDWSKILTLDFGLSKVDSSSFKYYYDYETSNLKVQFAYLSSLQSIRIQSVIKFPPQLVLSTPSQHKIKFSIQGINQAIIFQDENLLKTYVIASYMSLVIMILILIQFFVGSYFSKMIGLQTIQIVQFIYFVRILIKRQNTTVINALNQLKYTAFGGYSQPEILFGSLKSFLNQKFQSINKNFISINLDKYFLLNVNFTLLILIVFLALYSFQLVKKYKIRSMYIQSKSQQIKDKYTIQKRKSERYYDNFVFPYTLLFSFILIYNSIYFLQSGLFVQQTIKSQQSLDVRLLQQINYGQQISGMFNQKQRILTQNNQISSSSNNLQLFPVISFAFFLIMLIINFSIYSYELFQSYSDYKRNTMSQRQKLSMPFSLIQKLQYDQNDLQLKKNFHPLYSFVYLLYYQLLNIVIIVQINFVNEFKFGLQVVTGLSFIYFIVIVIWKPYRKQANWHNFFICLNHLTIVFFLAICLIFQRTFRLQTKYYIILMTGIMFLLILVVIGGYIRIIIQYRFNIMVDQNMIIVQNNSTEKKNQGITAYLKTNTTNKYLFRNQLQDYYRQKLNSLTIKDNINKKQNRQNINDQFQNQWKLDQQQQKNILKMIKKQYQQKKQKEERKNKQIQWQKQKAKKQENKKKKLSQNLEPKVKKQTQKDNIRINDDLISYKDCLIDQTQFFVKINPYNKKQPQNFIKAMQNLHKNKSLKNKSNTKK